MRLRLLLAGMGIVLASFCTYPTMAQGRADAPPAFDVKEHYTKYESYIPVRDGKIVLGVTTLVIVLFLLAAFKPAWRPLCLIAQGWGTVAAF